MDEGDSESGMEEMLDLMQAASGHTFGSLSPRRITSRKHPGLPPRKPGGGFFVRLWARLRGLLRRG